MAVFGFKYNLFLVAVAPYCSGRGMFDYELTDSWFSFFSYLQVEWEVRRGTPRLFTPDTMRSSNCRVPQQDNSSDCGLYLLQYAESFLQVRTHVWASNDIHVHPETHKSVLEKHKTQGLLQKTEGKLGGCVTLLHWDFWLAPQNPVVHFELPVRLDNWFPRQQVRQKREEIRSLIMEMHQSQTERRWRHRRRHTR